MGFTTRYLVDRVSVLIVVTLLVLSGRAKVSSFCTVRSDVPGKRFWI